MLLISCNRAPNSVEDFPYMKLSDGAVPLGESLHDTVQRVGRLWNELISASINGDPPSYYPSLDWAAGHNHGTWQQSESLDQRFGRVV